MQKIYNCLFKKIVFTSICILPIISATGEDTGAGSGCTLSLEAAQQRALENNPSLKAVGEKVEQAKALVKQVRSLYFPQVNANVNLLNTWLSEQNQDDAEEVIDYLQDTISDLYKVLGGLNPIVSPGTLLRMNVDLRDADNYLDELDEDINGVLEQYSYGITMQYLVFDGFSRKYTNAIARYGMAETEEAQREAKRLLLELVAQAYRGIQLSQENLKVAVEDQTFNLSLLEDAKVMLDYGKAPLSSVLNFDVAVKAAEIRQITAQGEVEAAKLALARLMGESGSVWNEDWKLCPLAAVDEQVLSTPDETISINYAIENRPDLQQKELSIERSEAEIKRRKGSYYPQVGLMTGLQDNFNFDGGFSADSVSLQVGVGVSIDLFTGGRKRAQVHEAVHAHREAEWMAEDALLNVQYEVRDALRKLDIAQKRYTLLVETSQVIQQTRDLVAEEFRAGKQSLSRLNQSQRDNVQADAQRVSAHAALLQAWFELNTATAKTLEQF